MDAFTLLLRAGIGVNLVSPLLPAGAALLHRRSGRYQALPWMDRLAIAVFFELAVNWTMLGMALYHRPNGWLNNLAHLPEVGLALWVLDGLGPRPIPRPVLAAAMGTACLSVAGDAARVGLGRRWTFAEATAWLILLAFCFWRLKACLQEEAPDTGDHHPRFWLLGAWILSYGVLLTFAPLHEVFLQRLSRDWILVPWFARFLVGLAANLAIARTFLCPKPSSS